MGLARNRRPPREAVQPSRGARLLSLPYLTSHMAVALMALVVIVIVAGGIGSIYIPPLDMLKIVVDKAPLLSLEHTWPESWNTIIWQIRFPRVILAVLVGGALAISGATYQGLFRNPIADPYLIGVASGAGLGATLLLVTELPIYSHGFSLLPIAAFAGGLLAVSIAYSIARQSGGLPLTTLILAGVAISSLASAAISLLIIRSDPDVRPVLAWLLGGFGGTQWRDVQIVLPYLVPGVVIMIAYSRILNLFQVDEDEARQLGVNVERTKLILIGAASLTTAAAVSVSGLIGFVGLIAPHAVRLIWRHDHRVLLPLSMMVGAGFLVLSDLVARTIVSPSELPVGVVTAFCGGPFFLYLLRRRGRVTL